MPQRTPYWSSRVMAASGKRVGGQVRNLYARHDQEPAVAHDKLAVGRLGLPGPTDVPVAICQAKGTGTEAHAAQHTEAFASDQIPHLRAAQRPAAQRMIVAHQAFPVPGGPAKTTAHRHDLDRPQLLKRPCEGAMLWRRSVIACRVLESPRSPDGRQIDQPALMEFAQSLAASHVFQPAVGPAPIEHVADTARQLAPGEIRFSLDQAGNPLHCIVVEFLSADNHADKYNKIAFRCSAQFVVNSQNSSR